MSPRVSKPEISKEELNQLIKEHSQRKIAKMLGVAQMTVCRWLRFYEIKSPRQGNQKHDIDKIGYTCIHCGKFNRSRRQWSANRRKFCNNSCQGLHARKIVIDNWLSGQISGLQDNGKRYMKAVKDYLIEQSENKCPQCGWDKKHPITGIVPLQVHHKDGDWKNCRPDNVTVLCPNCHSLTDTYCALNKGQGRQGKQRNTHHD